MAPYDMRELRSQMLTSKQRQNAMVSKSPLWCLSRHGCRHIGARHLGHSRRMRRTPASTPCRVLPWLTSSCIESVPYVSAQVARPPRHTPAVARW
eukprot:929957-Pyramimonas_sp.AAC.1